MTVKLLVREKPWDCEHDGHVVALRLRWDGDSIKVNPFCEACRMIAIPAPLTLVNSPMGQLLMDTIDAFKSTKEAPPEAYEHLFDD